MTPFPIYQGNGLLHDLLIMARWQQFQPQPAIDVIVQHNLVFVKPGIVSKAKDVLWVLSGLHRIHRDQHIVGVLPVVRLWVQLPPEAVVRDLADALPDVVAIDAK